MDAEQIFMAAVEKKTSRQRDVFLDDACGDNSEIRAQVEAWLESNDQAGSFLEQPLFDFTPSLEMPPPTETVGSVIGPYKLMEQIGEGGMGVVFVAQQEQPVRRKVALKIIKPGMDTKQVIARFEAERQALAMMNHPNIAKVLDAGTTGEVRDQKSEIREEELKRSPLTSVL
jgi:serine/threonine protein kinase